MRRSDNEPLLFDLPLDRPPRDDETEPLLERPAQRPSRSQTQQTPKTLGRTVPDPVRAARPSPAAAPSRQDPRSGGAAAAQPDEARSTGRAGIGRRAAGGAADLLVHLAVGVLAVAGCRWLGVVPVVHDWPALTVFLLSFSFLYTVVPLAFWGHTLGMTWAGLTSQSLDGEPLSFDQTARRWLGALLTLATLGLPLLLALGGRSLADRLSGSLTSVTSLPSIVALDRPA